MANFADWTAEVLPNTQGCPAPLAEDTVRDVVIDFCQRTHWLEATSATAVDVTGGASERAFAATLIPVNTRVVEVKRAWYNGEEIDVLSPDEAEEAFGKDWATQTGSPEALVTDRLDTYFIVPSPTVTATAALKIKAAIAPTIAATTCDDRMRVRWRDAIKEGAIARLCVMPDKKWTNSDRAMVGASVYGSAVSSASIAVARGTTRKQLTTKACFY